MPRRSRLVPSSKHFKSSARPTILPNMGLEQLEPRLLLSVNHAPIMDGNMLTAAVMDTVTENDTQSPGTTTEQLLNGIYTHDDDDDPIGIAITSLNTDHGSWQYTTDGGSTWSTFTASPQEARLLACDGLTRVRFVPQLGYYTTIYDAFTFRAWDGTQGDNGGVIDAMTFGGSSSLSSNTKGATVNFHVPQSSHTAPVAPSGLATRMPTVYQGAPLGIPVYFLTGDHNTGMAIIGVDDANGQWQYKVGSDQYGWEDAPGGWLSLDGTSLQSARLMSGDTFLRFLPNSGFSGNIDNAVHFVIWDGSSGTNIALIDVSQRGGATAFSQADFFLSVAVAGLNQHAILDNTGNMQMDPICANQFSNVGTTVSALLASAGGDRIQNEFPWMPDIIHITAADYNYGGWQYSHNDGAWQKLVPGTESLCSGNDRIRFVPDPGFYGTIADGLTFKAWDGWTCCPSVPHNGDSVDSETISITVNPPPPSGTDPDEDFVHGYARNQAPSLITVDVAAGQQQPPPSPHLAAIDQGDTSNNGTLVKDIIYYSDKYYYLNHDDHTCIGDLDFWAVRGIAVTATDTANGKWQFSTDDGATWWYLTASTTESRLLASDDATRVRFLPNAGYFGTIDDSLTFRAWDRNTGYNGGTADTSTVGGNTAFSVQTLQASISVRGSVDTGDPADTTVLTTFHQGGQPNEIAFQNSVAIVGTNDNYGTWEIPVNGQYKPLENISYGSAFLLPAHFSIYFIPKPGFTGTITNAIQYVLWDGQCNLTTIWPYSYADVTVRGGSTGFGQTVSTAGLTVLPKNSPPVLDASSTMTLKPISSYDFNNAGTTVSDIIASAGGDRITDADIDAVEGIFIYEVHNVHGFWQYKRSQDSSWTFMNAYGADLNAGDAIRFVPDAGFTGKITNGFSFEASDGTDVSTAHEAVGITVNPGQRLPDPQEPLPANVSGKSAPQLLNSGPYWDTITLVQSNQGTPVGSMLAGWNGYQGCVPGLAVVGIHESCGQWQYTINGGMTWQSLSGVSSTSARLLSGDVYTRIRFLPDIPSTGKISGDLTIRVWNLNEGVNGNTIDATTNGGTTSLSSGTATVGVYTQGAHTKLELNPQKTWTLDPVPAEGRDSGTLVDKLVGSTLDYTNGIAVVATDNDNGRWQYGTPSTGWTTILASMTSAVIVSKGQYIRFVPNSGFSGSVQNAIEFVAYDPCYRYSRWLDATIRGENEPFGNNIVTASIYVNKPVTNSAPVLEPVVQAVKAAAFASPMMAAASTPANPLLTSYGATVDKLVTQAGLRLADRDTGSKRGIAVTASEAVGGTWQYTVDNGKTWHTLKGYTTAARLLPVVNTTRVRFVLTSNFKGTRKATLTFRAWDRTKGSYGSTITSMVRGGMTYDSLANRTFTLAVPAGSSTPVKSAMPVSAAASPAVVGATAVKFASPMAETGLSQVSMASGEALAAAVAEISPKKQSGLNSAATKGDGAHDGLLASLLPGTDLDVNQTESLR